MVPSAIKSKELETKRIVLKLAPSLVSTRSIKYYMFAIAEVGGKPEDGSSAIKSKGLLMQKQSDLLLNADDLDAMWVCLRENCVIDDASGAEKMNYEDFCRTDRPKMPSVF
ncbi:hypothetical protein Tco_1348586 [Tanacetum coccineum]